MLKLSAPLYGLVMLCTSLSVFAAPAPVGSLAGQTFILRGDAFQAKLALTADGLGKIWRPDGYSDIHWTTQGDDLVATLDTPLESPLMSEDAQGNPVEGVTRLESLTFTFADGQKIVADVKETYHDIFPAQSGLPEATEEYENPALPFINYSTLQPFVPEMGSTLALPLAGDQSTIIKFADAAQAVLVEDPLNKAPSTFNWNTTDSLEISLSPTSSIRYTILESEGLASVLVGEVKADGKESIFISAGGVVDPTVYQTPASAAEFTGAYTIPEFKDTSYEFNEGGLAKIITTAADGTVTEGVLTWGEKDGMIYGNRWNQMVDGELALVTDPAVALACQAGTAQGCEVAQSRTYKILSKTQNQYMVLRVLDQKVENGVSTWVHVFNRAN